jgi:hypothetical protein
MGKQGDLIAILKMEITINFKPKLLKKLELRAVLTVHRTLAIAPVGKSQNYRIPMARCSIT